MRNNVNRNGGGVGKIIRLLVKTGYKNDFNGSTNKKEEGKNLKFS